eukprot:CAMPEP_0174757914 /NCGR_PEP_ID=MMETSP1094-20130205/107499_1 /TAXON_ID=156173 /ORGANISM="Chrysochromulina brevifilum, Strain UTEX LB 985" /LENGTH=556 /DNA_ID=CAMNT_0015963833 /DNA_START=42 /DNA_END=1712 /DNA_ORIENTATION=+
MATNGTSASGPSGEQQSEILPSGFRRIDLVRLLTQCLSTLGYDRSVAALEQESGIRLLSEPMARFRSAVLSGDWATIEILIGEATVRAIGFTSEASRLEAQCLVMQQKYLELLEAGRAEDALRCLRCQLAPIYQQRCPSTTGQQPLAPSGSLTDTLQGLSSCLMFSSAAELKARTGWPGAAGGSREALLSELSQHIPPSLLLPEDRLQTLLQQALMWQHSSCADMTWNRTAGRALLGGSVGTQEQVPCETRLVLDRHDDEVWLVVFSHNGLLLASASQDSLVVVWEVAQSSMPQRSTLCGHTDALCHLAWSPDDSRLLTCSHDQLLMLWDSSSGKCIQTYRKHTESVVSCAWLPRGLHFISAAADKVVLLWSVCGEVLQRWHGPRVYDLAVPPSGEMLMLTCEREILCCPLDQGTDAEQQPLIRVGSEAVLREGDAVTSLAISSDSRHLLVNMACEEVHLWDSREGALLHRYRGHKQGRFVIRSCFGGSDESLVISGSEDSQVYVWHRYSEVLLHTLPGHSGSVNAVAWSPRGGMFASASDDHTVRVWSARPAALI